MTEAQIKEVILKVLGRIAPEADLDTLDPDPNVREALDIDSFDHLNLLIGLNEELGVDGPGSRLRPAQHASGHHELPLRTSSLSLPRIVQDHPDAARQLPAC